MTDMVVRGNRVRCANCGTIYDKPPAQQVFWIGVPFRVEGMEFCPKCGSNAADIIITTITTNTSNWKASK